MLPTQQPLETKVRFHENQAILDMDGEINGLCEGVLQSAYAEIEGQGVKSVVLNFSEVTYINSTGIALIVGILAQARKTHTPVITFGLSDHYQEIFRVTRLADFMAIVPDEKSALAQVG